MLDVLILKHAKSSTAGTLPKWCQANGLSFEVARAEDVLARTHSPAAASLIVLGGNMQVWETDRFPWLEKEKAFIKSFIDAGKPVLGICLGAQLLAEQLGAQVLPMSESEVGWYRVRLENGKTLTPLHCHRSMFSAPAGAVVTATDDAHRVQAFQVAQKFYGFQFHTEIDQKRIEKVIDELNPHAKGRVQKPEELAAGFKEHGEELQAYFESQLAGWISRKSGSSSPYSAKERRA